MVETILPDVYIDVRAEGLIVPGRITVGRLGVIGTASRGPVGQVVTLGSFSEARAAFGLYDAWHDGKSDELTLTRALQLAFDNGASTVLAVRVAAKKNDGTTAAKSATTTLATAAGSGVTLSAATPGTWGNEVQVRTSAADENPYVTGEHHLGNVGPPITLDHTPVLPSARNRIRRFHATTGVTTSLVIVYDPAVAPTAGQVRVKPSTGELTFGDAVAADDTITASYLVDKASAVKVSVRYRTTAEDYTVLDGNDLLAQLAARPSTLATGARADHPDRQLTVTGTWAVLTGGDNAEAAGHSDYADGLDALLNEQAHIIVAAGQDESFGATLAAHCANASTDTIKHDRIAVVGSGVGDSLDTIRGHPIDSDRVIFVAPGITATDAGATPPVEVTLPGSYAAAAVAGLIAGLPAHFSPTNKPLRVKGLATSFSTPQLAQAVEARVLVLENRNGPRVVKGITTSTNTAWTQITTRRIVDYAKFGVRSAAEPYIGLLNNTRVRSAIRATINSFLTDMVNGEMLVSYDLDVTATRDEERKGVARVRMTLRPVFSIDYIQVTIFLE